MSHVVLKGITQPLGVGITIRREKEVWLDQLPWFSILAVIVMGIFQSNFGVTNDRHRVGIDHSVDRTLGDALILALRRAVDQLSISSGSRFQSGNTE